MIEVNDLVKRFNKFTAVDHISFDVKEGERFALLGPNGAGKSTTIKMLTTLLEPSEGQLFLNGYNVVKEKIKPARVLGSYFKIQVSTMI